MEGARQGRLGVSPLLADCGVIQFRQVTLR